MDINDENLVDAFRKSGKTQAEFCREHAIAIQKLQYYLYKKGKTTVKLSSRGHNHTLPPSFISFKTRGHHHTDTLSATIIHGRFTLAEISNLIHSLVAANA